MNSTGYKLGTQVNQEFIDPRSTRQSAIGPLPHCPIAAAALAYPTRASHQFGGKSSTA